MRTNVTFFIEDPQEDYQCDYVFRETISKDIYLMLEELEQMPNFEFWPHDYHDVEKPSTQKKLKTMSLFGDYQLLILRLTIDLGLLIMLLNRRKRGRN